MRTILNFKIKDLTFDRTAIYIFVHIGDDPIYPVQYQKSINCRHRKLGSKTNPVFSDQTPNLTRVTRTGISNRSGIFTWTDQNQPKP